MGPELLFEAIDQVETPDHYATPIEELAGIDVPAPRRAAPVLWCLSANDPRCSRDDSGEAPYRLQILSVPPVVGVTAMPHVPLAGVTRIRFDLREGHALPGVRGRVDRPPRS